MEGVTLTTRPAGTRTLAAKVRPDQTALVVVDYQNDFVAPGGALDKAGQLSPDLAGIHDCLVQAIEFARSVGLRIVFLRCEYSTTDDKYVSESFFDQARRRFNGLHHGIAICVPGSWGAEFYGDVRPIDADHVVTKHRFGGFDGTNLDLLLRSNGIRTLIFTGGVTQVCVESTVREAFCRDYFNIILRDVVAGSPRERHETSLAVMDSSFGEVVDLEQLRQAWGE